MKIDPQKKQVTLSVRELAQFTTGFGLTTTGPSLVLRGKLGSDAHRHFQSQRKKSERYSKEVHLDVYLDHLRKDHDKWNVRIRGRIDGLLEELDSTVVEEIKTIALPPARFAAFSPQEYQRHVRQVEIYLHLLKNAHPDQNFTGRLVYLNLPDSKQRTIPIEYDGESIRKLMATAVEYILEKEMRREDECSLRATVSSKLRFPFEGLRKGQTDILTTVEECLNKGNDLLLEAPTGLGKTVAVLFTTIKFALTNDKQILFLTSKTTQQALVLNTAMQIRKDNEFPRILLLQSRQKYCLMETQRCSPDTCPYLEEFRPRFRQSGILEYILGRGIVHPDDLSQIAEKEVLCPHEIQSAICDEFDVIIGDYNYAFDPGCRLIELFENRDPKRLILIVDEAHNLPERARSYYSASLPWSTVEQALNKAKEAKFNKFEKTIQEISEQFDYYISELHGDIVSHPIELSLHTWENIINSYDEAIVPYWYEMIASDRIAEDDPIFLLHRDLLDFLQALKYEGENFVNLVYKHPIHQLSVLCLDAAPFLRETILSVHTTVAMSATIHPKDVHLETMGMGDDTVDLDVASPFPSEHCHILIDPTVTTLYRQRKENVKPIAKKIDRFYSIVRRRTLVFFPSFDFMRSVTDQFDSEPVWIQAEEMGDSARMTLLDNFMASDNGLLCCVMGGIFAEGIDLPGDIVEAAVVVGVGIPQVNTENEMIRVYYDRRGFNGFDYAYLNTGMRRVIQSAGRIIRSETDTGIILLLDQRFANINYQRLFPRHWYKENPNDLIAPDWEVDLLELM